MTHYYVELLLWLLFAYLIGCLIGALARKIMAGAPTAEVLSPETEPQTLAATTATAGLADAAGQGDVEPLPGRAPLAPRWSAAKEPETMAAVEPVAEEQSMSAAAETPAAEVLTAVVQVKARMPVGISAPRAGGPDELQRISGVGPKNEQILHSLGFYHFDQIAQWSDEQVEWVDGYLRFNGRIRRENWVEQCRLLAAGDEAEFARLYGTGGMVDASGTTQSGEKTRR